MKRFVLKFLLFIVPVFLFFLAVNFLYERTNYWKSKDYANKYTDAPDNLELGCIGSSIPCYALKFDVTPQIKAWNFANETEVYFWSYRVLKNYIKHFKEGAVIIVEIPLFGINERPTSFRERYYRILPKEDMDKWSFSEWLAYKKFPLLSSGRFKVKIFDDISEEEMSPYYNKDSCMNEEDLKDFAKKAFTEWSATGANLAYKKNQEEVSAILDLCYKHKMLPVIVSYPVTKYTMDNYAGTIGFLETFSRFTKELQEKYPGLVYLDYSSDSDFAERHEFFKDAVHMNNAGAEAFTLKLVGDLRARGLIK